MSGRIEPFTFYYICGSKQVCYDSIVIECAQLLLLLVVNKQGVALLPPLCYQGTLLPNKYSHPVVITGFWS
jgi:hypothetical protein